jgi:hypothetical protein
MINESYSIKKAENGFTVCAYGDNETNHGYKDYIFTTKEDLFTWLNKEIV